MKTRIILLCVMFNIAIINTFAQIDQFDLSKYKEVDYKRQSLDFNFNFNGNGYISSQKTDNYLNKNNDNNIAFSLNPTYNYLVYNRKKQLNIHINSVLSPINYSFLKTTNDNDFQKRISNSNLYRLNVSCSNYYYNQNQKFIYLGFNLDNYFGSSNQKYEYKTNYIHQMDTIKYSNLTTNNSIVLGIGKGRIEYIEDARLAIFILNDLIKNKTINRELSEEEILKFSGLITQIKNKRYFDYRHRKIYELQALDTFLKENNIVTNGDIKYYTALNDNWEYSHNPVRTSGSRISFNISPELFYQEYRNTLNTPEMNYTKILGGSIYGEYRNDKPINLKWQRNYWIQAGYTKNKYSTNSYLYGDFSSDKLFLRIGKEIGFYPNSRTYFTASLSNNLYKAWNKDVLVYTENDYDIYDFLSFDFHTYYYLSERLNLEINTGFDYSYWHYKAESSYQYTNEFRPFCLINLNYALF